MVESEAPPTVAAVLDASAAVAYLTGEPGGSVVRQLVEDGRALAMHAINAVEVFYDFQRAQGADVARSAINALEADGVEIRPDLDRAFWEDIADLKAVHRRVSLADCCGLALARKMAGEFYTADRHELAALQAAGAAQIVFIR